MDEVSQNIQKKKCSYCRNENHIHTNFQYRQLYIIAFIFITPFILINLI